MTSKKRVLSTIRGRPVDKIPVHHIQFSGHAGSVVLGREALVGGQFLQWKEMHALWNGPDAHKEFDERCTEDAVAIAEACGHDILRLSYWRWPKNDPPVRKVDEYTFLFGNPEATWYTMTYNPDIELLTRQDGYKSKVTGRHAAVEPEITEESLTEMVAAEEENAKKPHSAAETTESYSRLYKSYPDYILKLGSGAVSIGRSYHSPQQLMAVALWPDLMARLLMAQAEQIAAKIPALAQSGMQVNFNNYDFCSNQGPAFSPEAFRDVVMPALKHIVDACHQNDMYFFYASDGNFWKVAEYLFTGAGVDGFFELDKSAGMTLRELRIQFPKTTFVGNIRSQVLHRGSKEDVVEEVMSCLEVAKESGGVIVGCSNLIMAGTPAENIVAMLETIERHRTM